MSNTFSKFAILIVASFTALIAAAPFGPLGNPPGIMAINDSYLALARNHELYLGLVGFLGVFLANIWVKAHIIIAIASATLGGSLFFILVQGEDPEFFSHLSEYLFGFHMHYLAAGLIVVALP